ncbi:MAG TPA: hypothetical protein PKM59_01950 [Thermodesulfobacteriota bacterium]|nr:hypothetical protein [Thermodesulfobacteriota bacterium]HNU70576.1 hypothetical protein [Thermodesulfobacteriota bacterium]
MSNRSDYIAAIGELVPGSHPIGEPEKRKAIAKALAEHSRNKPRVIVEDEVGNGTHEYALSALALWQDDFSIITQIEYPVDDDDETKDYLEAEDWTIYQKPAGYYLHFLNDTPLATESMRITYTAPHTCTDADCTVADADEEAVQSLAAAHFCRMLAACYAQDQDATIQADSVDHSSKRREYEAQAKAYRQEYYKHMNIDENRPKPACATADWDVVYPNGWDRLTHPRRQR